MNSKLVIVLAVVALFAGVLVAKVVSGSQPQSAAQEAGTTVTTGPSKYRRPAPTLARNDAMADYEAALKAGKPIYVMFHSST
jgi:hypothetical protein